MPVLTQIEVVRAARGDAEGALADHNKAISIDRHLATAYFNRGVFICIGVT
jgi:hypothetical protein